MLNQMFSEVYQKFKLHFYKKIFSRFEEREASLTAIETFCVEVIYALNKPTINELAQFIEISQPNAAYKVNRLVKKGYINRIQSQKDKREFRLEVTEKFFNYYGVNSDYMLEVTKRIEQRFTKEEVDQLQSMLHIISTELMPEIELPNKH